MIWEYLHENPEATRDQVVEEMVRQTGLSRKHVGVQFRKAMSTPTTGKGTVVEEEEETRTMLDRQLDVITNKPVGKTRDVSRREQNVFPAPVEGQVMVGEPKFHALISEHDLYFASKSNQLSGMMTLHHLSDPTWVSDNTVRDITDDSLLILRRNLAAVLTKVEDELEDRQLIGRITKRQS